MLGQPRRDALDGGQIARAVVLPQPAEAPQLALEVALGPGREVRQAGARQSTRVHLDERVDELLADPPALGRRVERGRHARRHDVARDALHDVERRADQRRVVADGEHGGNARGGRRQRAQQPRLAQDVVRAGRQRAARRAAQDELATGAAQQQRDVGMAVAERLDGELVGRRGQQAALDEKRQQRLGRRRAARARARPPRRGWRRRRRGPARWSSRADSDRWRPRTATRRQQRSAQPCLATLVGALNAPTHSHSHPARIAARAKPRAPRARSRSPSRRPATS